jgi:hypothetical protein
VAPNPHARPLTGSAPKKGFNWKGFLIESAIAIAIFNIIAGFVTWYFILPRLKH